MLCPSLDTAPHQMVPVMIGTTIIGRWVCKTPWALDRFKSLIREKAMTYTHRFDTCIPCEHCGGDLQLRITALYDFQRMTHGLVCAERVSYTTDVPQRTVIICETELSEGERSRVEEEIQEHTSEAYADYLADMSDRRAEEQREAALEVLNQQ